MNDLMHLSDELIDLYMTSIEDNKSLKRGAKSGFWSVMGYFTEDQIKVEQKRRRIQRHNKICRLKDIL